MLSTKIYRYYVRSQEEGDVLAKKGKENANIKDATAIVVGDAYGKGASESFKTRWEESNGYNFHDLGVLPKDADEEYILSINNVDSSKNSDFDMCWSNNKVPEHILTLEEYKENEKADIGVPMQIKEFKFENIEDESINNH